MSFGELFSSPLLQHALKPPAQKQAPEEQHPDAAHDVQHPADNRPPSNAHNVGSILGGLSAITSPVAKFAQGLGADLLKPETKGEQKAHSAIDTSTVADKRSAAEKSMHDGNAQTTSRGLQLYNEAVAGKTPPGTHGSIDPKTGDAVITRKDAKGDVVSSERISYGANGSTSIETSNFETVNGKSMETTSRQTAGLDGSYTTTEASQPGAPSKAAPGKLDDKALMADRTGNVSYQSTSLGNSGSWIGQDGGKLTEKSISVSGGKASESQTQYWHEDDVKVDDKLKGAFHDGGADKSETRTFSIGGGTPSFTKSIATSQGSGATGVQATSTVSKNLEDPVQNVCLANHSADDALNLAAKNQDALNFDGNTKSPKQWLLEKSTGDEYKSQTFIEGHTDASVITDKKVSGSTVTQTQSGKWFDDKGKVNDVSGNASTTYGADGRINAFDSHQTDASGNASDETFSRRKTKDGESTDLRSWNTPANGTSSFYEQKEATKNGQLANASQEIDQNGHIAYATDNGGKTSLTVDGQSSSKGLTVEQQTLAAQAGGKLQGQLANFALTGGGLESKEGEKENPTPDLVAKGLDAVKGLGGGITGATEGLQNQRIAQYMKGSESIDSVERDLRNITAGGSVLAGGTGLLSAIPGGVASGTALANAIQSGNGFQIGQAGAGVAGSAIGLGQSGLLAGGGLAQGIKGGTSGLGALDLAAKLDKFGVAAGVLGGGIQGVNGIINGNTGDIAKGGITALGAAATPFVASAATEAVGGMLAADTAVGAVAGSEVPILGNAAGALAGLAVGGLTYGATKLVDAFEDSDHQIADRKI